MPFGRCVSGKGGSSLFPFGAGGACGSKATPSPVLLILNNVPMSGTHLRANWDAFARQLVQLMGGVGHAGPLLSVICSILGIVPLQPPQQVFLAVASAVGVDIINSTPPTAVLASLPQRWQPFKDEPR